MLSKYFKPKSVTWWVGVVVLLAALVTALGQEFELLAPYSNIIMALAGVQPAVMVTFGLSLIGLRGAQKD